MPGRPARGSRAEAGLRQALHFEGARITMTESELLLAAETATGVGAWALDAVSGRMYWTPQAVRLLQAAGQRAPASRAEWLAQLEVNSGTAWATALDRGTLGHVELSFRDGVPAAVPLFCVFLPGTGTVGTLQAGRPADVGRTEFMSRLSHELRTPLNAVLGFAQLMALDPVSPLSEAQRARLAHVQSAGWHLLSMLDDMMDLARLDARSVALSPGAVPLPELLREVLESRATAGQQRGVSLRLELADDAPAKAWADRNRVQQLLQHLVGQALRWSRAGAEVVVALSATLTGEAVIDVRAAGAVFSAQQMQRLFEPFQPAAAEPAAGSLPGPGNGVGLVLCRQLAQQMHGSLDVHSASGAGTVLTLVLPTDVASAVR